MKSLGITKKLTKVLVGGSLLLGLVGGSLLATITSQLPTKEVIQNFEPQALPTKVFDQSGQMQKEIFDGNLCYSQEGKEEDLEVLGQYAIASEDPNFNQHIGIEYPAIIRAGIANLKAGKVVEGASTITVQIAGIILERESASYRKQNKWQQKLTEFLLAYKIENLLTKKQILNKYLALVPGPNNNCGVFAISSQIFGKEVKELDQNEVLTMVSMFPGPQAFFNSPSLLLQRRNLLIDRLAKRETNYGTKRLFDDQTLIDMINLKDLPLPNFKNSLTVYESWAIDTVQNELKENYGESVKNNGYKVTTTIKTEFQKALEEVTENYQANLPPKSKISTTIYDSQYNIVALDNLGKKTSKNAFNVAYLGKAPFGSVFKGLVYLDYVLDRYNNGLNLDRLCFARNYLFEEKDKSLFKCGNVTSYFANSDNQAAIGAYNKTSLEKFYSNSFNSKLVLGPGDASALGTDDMNNNQIAMPYIAIANGGYVLDREEQITSLLSVSDRKGESIYSNQARRIRIIPQAVVDNMQQNMAEVVISGTGQPAFTQGRRGGVRGGKSGTTCYGKSSCAAIFVTIFDIDDQIYVMVTRIFNDNGGNVGYGGSTAGRFNALVIDRINN